MQIVQQEWKDKAAAMNATICSQKNSSILEDDYAIMNACSQV